MSNGVLSWPRGQGIAHARALRMAGLSGSGCGLPRQPQVPAILSYACTGVVSVTDASWATRLIYTSARDAL